MSKVFCKKCKYIGDPRSYFDGVGTTFTSFLCTHPSNMSVKDSWEGEIQEFIRTPNNINAANDCANYEALELQDVVCPTKEQLAELLTAKKIEFGQSLIQDFSTMNTLRGLTSDQIKAVGTQFGSLQMLLMAGSIETSYGIICSLSPSALLTQDMIDAFKAKIEAFNLTVADLKAQLIALCTEV